MRYLHQMLAAALLATTVAAQATTIDFDNVFVPPPNGGPLGGMLTFPVSGYLFTNMDVLYTNKYPLPITVGTAYSGVNAGVTRDGYKGPITIKREDGGAFWFESVQFRALPRSDVVSQFTVVGLLHGSYVGSVTIDATKSWQLALNNFGAVDELRLSMNKRWDWEPYYWDPVAIDDLKVTAVPEPETYAMMLAGLGILGFTARRKRSAS